MNQFDVPQDLDNARPRDLIYENSGRLLGPAARGYTGTNSGVNSVEFIHELKQEAANDQRHALRAPKPHFPPYSAKPGQPAAFRAASRGAGGPRGGSVFSRELTVLAGDEGRFIETGVVGAA